ncbi:uncharacterized protein Z518_02333 [Rhinocladiella mackenziei CBS 650.93]|uniref:Uncharacterized protein n=1 Tax=Rhinocladiella mackenziei CBS 650.93 TaxID=1442369 RepID=A0A0D2IP88_9EURO|nr:uncharacterized protein Z518_02333 [Rhinocladiella mackenziei CBS 650.93]KIX07679.1 hypothetical protein Z518_02333 [Rhinocladiella mackenziei CBS 650.93]
MVACSSFFAFGLLAVADLVAGHGAIVAATGDAGGSGTALGIDSSTPRDGTRRRPFQQDTTRFRGDSADTFGETLEGGDNDPETGTAAILAESGDQLPQITPGGEVQMTLHQVNADGAGPYTCMINDDGTGTTWTQMTVTQNVPGERGRDRDGQATDFPLTAQVPAGQTCTGTVAGQENVCMVRCQNPARAGPFGGVVPVQMPNTAAATEAATNGTATATTANTGSAAEIADANTPSDTATPAQAAAEIAEDEAKKRKARRSSRIERRSAAAISYRAAVRN